MNSVSDNPGKRFEKRSDLTLKGLLRVEPLQGCCVILMTDPRVVAALQPWAEISERLQRYD